MILDPELQAAAAPLETPAVAPTPTVPQVAAPFQSNPTAPTPAPTSGFAPLGAPTAPAAAQPVTAKTQLAAALGPALAKNPLQLLGKVAVAGHIAAGLNLLSGVTNALSDVAAPPDSGMAVLSQTAQNIEAQKAARAQAVAAEQQQVAAAKQKAFENQLKMQNSATDKQKADAAMIDAHAKFITSMRVDNDSSSAHNTAMAKNSESFVKPILDSGGEILYPSVSEAELHSQEFLNTLPQDPKHGGPDYTQFMPVFTGTSPILNSDGTPKLSDAGVPMFQRNFEIVKLGKPVTLDESHAAFLNKNNPSGQPFQVGQVLPAQLYTREWQAAHVAQGVQLNVQKTQAQIQESLSRSEQAKATARNENMTADEKSQNLRTSAIFAKYLADPRANGDPVRALDLLKGSKDASLVGLVEKLYGPGTLEKVRQDNLVSWRNTIKDNQKRLDDDRDAPKKDQMSDQDRTDLQNEIKYAHQNINVYSGLHPSDPDQFASAKSKLKGMTPDQQVVNIMLWPAPPGAKKYLLMNMGLPVPPSLKDVQPISGPPQQ